jgi:putative ABC transport system permease protein
VTIVNPALAESLWPGGSAVGRRLGIVGADGPQWYTVVGVAAHVTYEEFGEETAQSRRNLYLPYAASPWRTMAVLLRSRGEAGPLLADTRAALARLAPQVPVYDASTLQQRRVQTTWGERVFSHLLGGFAGMALLLACVGIYGLMAVSAGQRIHEIGVRLALGAGPRDVLWLLLRRGLWLAGLGLLLGLPLALGAGVALSGAVFAVDPFDPRALALLSALLTAAVALASYLPARRAAGTDPALALRHD